MANSRGAQVGLSIEPGLIAAAHVRVNGTIRIEDGGCAPLDPDIVRDGDVADTDGLADALRALWLEHPQLGKQVRIGVANARIVVRTLYLPPITDPKELANAVSFQAAEAIPMPVKDAVIDFHPVGITDGPNGPRQRIILVAARRDMITGMLTAARAAGLKPIGIDLSAFGMIRALQRQRREGDAPELFVGVGGLTNLAIADRGVCVFTRVAGGGLEALAAELAERRELTAAQARAWLQDVGVKGALEYTGEDVAIAADARGVLTAGVSKIAGEIRASLDFPAAHAENGLGVESVVLTGPAMAVPGFTEALADHLGLEVAERTVESNAALKLSALDSACLCVAAGLAFEGELPA
jgi:type IV pilus assembly protein PilM